MDENTLNENYRHFIGLLQDTINRMANNSANCKNWLFVVVAAIIAFVAENKEASNILWALLIVDGLFYFFDAYYLRLENNFRDIEALFVEKVKSSQPSSGSNSKPNQDVMDLLYNFNFKQIAENYKMDIDDKNRKKALLSHSTWPFYLTMAIMIVVVIGVLQEWHPLQAICDFFSHCHCGCDCKCK